MRYIINDDDVEAWIGYLEEVNKDIKNDTIQYVIDDMKREVEDNINMIKTTNVRQ